MRGRSSVGVVAALLCATASACSHLPPSAYARVREARYFAVPRELTPRIRDAIERGHVVLGMDREQVWVVLGNPLRQTTFRSDVLIEVWLYPGYKLHQDRVRADLFRVVLRDGILVLIEPL